MVFHEDIQWQSATGRSILLPLPLLDYLVVSDWQKHTFVSSSSRLSCQRARLLLDYLVAELDSLRRFGYHVEHAVDSLCDVLQLDQARVVSSV